MMKLTLLLSLACLAHGQTFTGPALAAICPGTTTWDSTNDPAMAAAPYPSLLYVTGRPFTCTVPVKTAGMTAVSVAMEEPNKSGAGQRVFSITVNGQQSASLDLFSLTGGKLRTYEYDPSFFYATSKVSITFTPTVGNAVVSAITVLPSPSPSALIPRSWEELHVMAATASYSLGAQPVAETELDVYRNGVHFASGIDYELVGQVVTFVSTQPQMGDIVDFLYRAQSPTVACLSAPAVPLAMLRASSN